MSRLRQLRASDWLLTGYFGYVALIWPWAGRRWLLAAGVAVLLAGIATWERRNRRVAISIVRDWLVLALALLAYREMDWFTPAVRDYHLEKSWIVWDRLLLHTWGLQRAIESAGAVWPSLLEISYCLVYAAGPFALAVLYIYRKRERAGRFLLIYLTGTLLAYALFPYFPSEPPRTAFPGADMPQMQTVFRSFNLWILGGYGIHSSVFPSAHVSSVFSAAWGLLLVMPERRRIGWAMLCYSAVVAISTIYGRYHYAVDAIAGFGVSLVALGLGWLIQQRNRAMASSSSSIPRPGSRGTSR
ncbi:MAG: phosphatase PAP2 family protein [Bryobacteraceae bacterium]